MTPRGDHSVTVTDGATGPGDAAAPRSVLTGMPPPVSSKDVRCDACGVTVPTAMWAGHRKGKKHVARLRSPGNAAGNHGDARCECCAVVVPAAMWAEHCKGTWHVPVPVPVHAVAILLPF